MNLEDVPVGEKVEFPDVLAPGERRLPWEQVPEIFEPYIIGTFVKALNGDPERILRIFNVACPRVIIGKSYWRIAPSDGALLKRLLCYYIK